MTTRSTAAELIQRAQNLSLAHTKLGPKSMLGLIVLLLASVYDFEVASEAVERDQDALLTLMEVQSLHSIVGSLVKPEPFTDVVRVTDSLEHGSQHRLSIDALMHGACTVSLQGELTDSDRLSILALLFRCAGFPLADSTTMVAGPQDQILADFRQGLPLYVVALRLTSPPGMEVIWVDEPND